METKFNKEQVCELDEKVLVNAFEVDELEKRYEMGWVKAGIIGASQGYDLPTLKPVPMDDVSNLTYPQYQVTPEGVDITANLEIH